MGTFVITGGASGIGAAIDARLQRQGHEVITVDVDHATIVADLATDEGRRTAILGVKERAPKGVDGLVACAGLGPQTQPVCDIIRVNYFGAIVCIEGLRDLVTKRSGAILVLSSNSAPMGYDPDFVASLAPGNEKAAVAKAASVDGQTAYGGSKLALTRWMRRSSVEWAGLGVRINALAPGYTETAMTEAGLQDPDYGPLMKDFARTIPLGRTAKPDDQAAAACFLLSEDARYVCGSVLFVDGGHDALFRPDDF